MLEEILKNSDFAGAAAYFIVNVDVPKPEAVRFNASMDAQLLARIDQWSREIGMTRSGFLAEAARKELAGRRLRISQRKAGSRTLPQETGRPDITARTDVRAEGGGPDRRQGQRVGQDRYQGRTPGHGAGRGRSGGG